MKFEIFLFLIPYICCEITNVKTFISNLISNEGVYSTYILKIGNSRYYDEIIESIFLPKVIFQDGSKINYLNFPRYERINSLKYYFNREFITLVIAEDIEENFIESKTLHEIILYSRDQILAIITEKTCNYSDIVINNFFLSSFTNVIYLNIDDFEKTQAFQTFEAFPFKISYKTRFEKEIIKNVNLKELKVSCNDQYPFSKCIVKNDHILTIGRSYHLITNFVDFINGSISLYLRNDGQLSASTHNDPMDLWTETQAVPIQHHLKNYPLTTEIIQNIFEKLEVYIMVQKAGFIRKSLYIVKPFSVQLCILFLVFVLYGSITLSLAIFIIKRENIFWKLFDHFLRSLLSQSYPNPLPGLQITIIYLLAMFMGFVMVVWYSALLGCFLTTYIREPQVSTLAEFKKANFKLILGSEQQINTTVGYNEVKDIITHKSFEQIMEIVNAKIGTYGHIVSSGTWEAYPERDDYFILKDFIFESNFVSFRFPLHSLYKNRFHRYVHLIYDTGLYEFWKSRISEESFEAFDNYKSILFSRIHIDTSNRRVLNFDYFLYPLILLGFGFICGFIVFLVEMFLCKTLYLISSYFLLKIFLK